MGLRQPVRRTDDSLWKGMLEDTFDDFLRFIFPNADELFNISQGFEFLDKELVKVYPEPEKGSDTRLVDKLVKVYKQDGSEEWILVHVEVQGRNEKGFAERMFKYYCRIFDKYNKPITAIAILTGKDGKSIPSSYEYSYAGTMLSYRYNTLRILDFADKRKLLQVWYFLNNYVRFENPETNRIFG
ncbi:MAG: hypothetical protein JST68_20465 [Bacteroidetes bacterium]|nr:hypothetical protein [Bacteroidota bacterium]